MTEAEWLACDLPQELLNFIEGRTTGRKLRLFAVACCRRISDGLSRAGLQAVEIAEQLADGGATAAQLAAVHQRLPSERATYPANGWDHVARAASAPNVFFAANATGTEARFVAHPDRRSAEYAAHSHLICCIFGNPFRPPNLDPAWHYWNDGVIRKLAQAIYDDRAFDRLPILADALEDAGCDDADILAHCRQPGEHVRGCWVVDLLLGKQ
jgi:hypothetical protein